MRVICEKPRGIRLTPPTSARVNTNENTMYDYPEGAKKQVSQDNYLGGKKLLFSIPKQYKNIVLHISFEKTVSL